MSADYQFIDGFERLREEYSRENPAAPPRPTGDASIPQRVAVAWLKTQDGKLNDSPAQQRRLRSLVRRLTEPSAPNGDSPVADAPLLQRAGDFPAALVRAAERRLAPLADNAPPLACEQEADAWRSTLPALGGMRVWRFMELLERPAIEPRHGMRRTLWRLGLIDDAGGQNGSGARFQDAVQRLAQLTGIALPQLASLLRWMSGGEAGAKGGGWCGAKPRCEPCPLKPSCMWPRFHPAGAGETEPDAALDAIDARRRLAEGRCDELSETDLLALALPARSGGIAARQVADNLLRRFDGLRGLERASPAELAQVRGLATGRAIALKAALELGRRMADRNLQPGDPIKSSGDIWRAYRGRFRNIAQEHFVIILLDTKNRVIQDHVVSKGTLNGSLAHPREVFNQAVRHSAAAIILMHNHPSGDPTPSPEDKEVTARLKEAGEILGIKVLDHIVLGADKYYSFKDEE